MCIIFYRKQESTEKQTRDRRTEWWSGKRDKMGGKRKWGIIEKAFLVAQVSTRQWPLCTETVYPEPTLIVCSLHTRLMWAH